MTALIVDQEFWSLFPDAQIFAIELRNIDNHIPTDQTEYQLLLSQAEEQAKSFLTAPDFKNNSVIAEWRTVMTKFKKKKGARASIEALLKRVDQGHTFTPINPLVDIYNSISLTYGVPCGGEDLDTLTGTMHLGLAQGNEAFYPIGSDKNDPPRPQEVIYYDTSGAVCRSLNWRDGERTMLTERTKNAILIIEGITDQQKARAQNAINALQSEIFDRLKVKGTIKRFSRN
ncbi:B3/B4 domain-containing protein [Lactobacillus xylocopicola]|uniref:B3/B4 tRNA-binding domain-containing protein n=1 Tax=Lactobacillus xylocopicola TaxID=2976676 RepID=A0ABN6SIQ8_9LACO|nr:B3/4 domain-containing protein [Lactobacillus xylocopicola]BDR60020.1 hypothetical protein KIM322_02810 [Lactobacillus xylocopicola]